MRVGNPGKVKTTGNYHLIIVTLLMGKLLVAVIKEVITEYLESNSYMSARFGLISKMTQLKYEKRLGQVCLYSLEYRGDLIEPHNILTGQDRLDTGRIFLVDGKSKMRVVEELFRIEVRKNVFSQRVMNV